MQWLWVPTHPCKSSCTQTISYSCFSYYHFITGLVFRLLAGLFVVFDYTRLILFFVMYVLLKTYLEVRVVWLYVVQLAVPTTRKLRVFYCLETCIMTLPVSMLCNRCQVRLANHRFENGYKERYDKSFWVSSIWRRHAIVWAPGCFITFFVLVPLLYSKVALIDL